MDFKALILIVLSVLPLVCCGSNIGAIKTGNCPNLKNSLGSIRKRRNLAFPTGSAVSLTASVVKTFMTHVPSGWFFVVEAEMIWKLPESALISVNMRRKVRHRQKREIWELLRSALDERNMNGRACILRAVCEAQVLLAPKGKSLVHDLLRSLFSIHAQEEDFREEIGNSYNELLQTDFCEKAIDCPFSFLTFILDLNMQESS